MTNFLQNISAYEWFVSFLIVLVVGVYFHVMKHS